VLDHGEVLGQRSPDETIGRAVTRSSVGFNARASGWSDYRGRDRAEARALGTTKSRFLGPPCNPGRSDFPIPVLTLAFPREAFPRQAKLKRSLTYPPPSPVYLAARPKKSWLLRLPSLTMERTAKCPELLCLTQALLMTGWRQAPPRRALPLLHRSYELMRRTSSSSGLRVSTLISRGPCRLLRAPAGNWFFPTLSLQVFPRMLEP
jgi:hypothetical protein